MRRGVEDRIDGIFAKMTPVMGALNKGMNALDAEMNAAMGGKKPGQKPGQRPAQKPGQRPAKRPNAQ